jgi:hypothetical protein
MKTQDNRGKLQRIISEHSEKILSTKTRLKKGKEDFVHGVGISLFPDRYMHKN